MIREAIVTISFILPPMNSRYEKDFFLLLYIFTNKFSVACTMIFLKCILKKSFYVFTYRSFKFLTGGKRADLLPHHYFFLHFCD